MAALHFLLPTGDSRSGRRSLIPNISLLPLDEVPVHVHRFAARAPCDSKGSECQCGIHTAEAASALRSRKTERAAKEKPTPISEFFLAPAAPNDPQFSEVGELSFVNFVGDLQAVETILLTEAFKLGIVILLQTTADGAAVGLGIKHVLGAVPGVNEGARLLGGQGDSHYYRHGAHGHRCDQTN